jgi:hypothetical protein
LEPSKTLPTRHRWEAGSAWWRVASRCVLVGPDPGMAPHLGGALGAFKWQAVFAYSVRLHS